MVKIRLFPFFSYSKHYQRSNLRLDVIVSLMDQTAGKKGIAVPAWLADTCLFLSDKVYKKMRVKGPKL